MAKIDAAAWVAIAVAVLAGVLAFGTLRGELNALKPEEIKKAKDEALIEIKNASTQNLSALPIGTVISSVLDPQKFRELPGYVQTQWVRGNGDLLPAGTKYEEFTKIKNAPNLLHVDNALSITGIKTFELSHGQNANKAIGEINSDPTQRSWTLFASLKDVQGSAGAIQEWEQDSDRFQIWINGDGIITAQGSTYNWKAMARSGGWSKWSPGNATVLGIQHKPIGLFHYVKVN